MEVKGYRVSRHLADYLRSQRSNIKLDWIERAIESPDHTEEVSEKELRIWKQIPEFGNRFLRVVLNPERKIVVTAFFDRGFRP